MPNKSSPYGGAIREGTVSAGTLRSADLLRAFADEYERILPFNGRDLYSDAREIANYCDAFGEHKDAADTIEALIDALNECGARQGFTFGAHPGDGADFGFWRDDD